MDVRIGVYSSDSVKSLYGNGRMMVMRVARIVKPAMAVCEICRMRRLRGANWGRPGILLDGSLMAGIFMIAVVFELYVKYRDTGWRYKADDRQDAAPYSGGRQASPVKPQEQHQTHTPAYDSPILVFSHA
jgi:hypothetical protein